jgi:transposase
MLGNGIQFIRVFTTTKRADHLHHDNAPARSTALVQAFVAKHHITQVYQPPYSQDLASCGLWLFPNLKSPLKGKRFVNATVTQSTSSVNGISLPTD